MTNTMLAIVIGLVVLSTILLSLSIGFGCFFCRQKKKRSLASRMSPSAEPNIYVNSSTISKSGNAALMEDGFTTEGTTLAQPAVPQSYKNDSEKHTPEVVAPRDDTEHVYDNAKVSAAPATTRDEDNSDVNEGEYEEAATVIRPEIPSRENR